MSNLHDAWLKFLEHHPHIAELRDSYDFPKFRTADDGLQPFFSSISSLDCSDCPSLTKQAFKDECDVNNIVNSLDLNGALDSYRGSVPQFIDATLVPDFHDAMNQVAYAHEVFEELPAAVRFRFSNDPGRFMDFLHDPSNAAEAVKLGLATPPLAPIVSEPPQAGKLDLGGSIPPVPATD